MKATKTFTIDHDIYIAARATGSNLSEIVEQALAAHINYHSSAPSIFDVFSKGDDETNKFLNQMVDKVGSRGYPGVCKGWAEMIKSRFDFHADPYELYKFVKELVEDG